MTPTPSPALLLIGGMDTSGGAGVIRDTMVAAGFGLTPRVVVTAVTAQTDAEVVDIHVVPTANVSAQVRAAGTGPVGAVKIGMLARARIVSGVAAALPRAPLVLDPVLVSTSGRRLLDFAGLEALIAELLPRTDLLTPNLQELDAIAAKLGIPGHAPERQKVAACLRHGCRAVLVKGGHSADPGSSIDRLYRRGHVPVEFRSRRYPFNLRGTGCHLASGIAAGLCRGEGLEKAIGQARDHLVQRFEDAKSRAPETPGSTAAPSPPNSLK